MKIVVLFGAGASAFSGPCLFTPPDGKPIWRNPPLGSGHNGLFSTLHAEGGFARSLPEEFKQRFIDDFEGGMEFMRRAPQSAKVALQKQISLHLLRYDAVPDNHYYRLLKRRELRSPDILYSSLNYDILLEHSLTLLGSGADYSGNLGQPFVQVLKPHGSANYYPVSSNILEGNRVIDSEIPGITGNFKIGLFTSFHDADKWCRDNSELSPIIAQYALGKQQLFSAGRMDSIMNKWAWHVVNAEHVFIVGVRFVEADHHIWGPLGMTKGKIWIVDPSPAAAMHWLSTAHRTVTHLSDSFEKVHKLQRAMLSALAN